MTNLEYAHRNVTATAHNLLCRFDALKAQGECRGWGGEKWAKFCDKMEDMRAAVAAAEKANAEHVAAKDMVKNLSAGLMWDY